MSKKSLIPELRFPEFKDELAWSEKPLDKLSKKVTKKNTEGSIDLVLTNSATEGIVDQREYFDKDIANKRNLENYYIVQNGDYVYNPRISREAPVGPVSKNKTDNVGVMSPLYTVFRFNKKENSFYEYYFNTYHWYNAIRKVANKGARYDRISINDNVFMGIEVLSPEPKEQQKIAQCLSSLDELIQAHTVKLEALQYHKNGLLQNLFPQEGQKVPNYRFPEFKEIGNWKTSPFSKVFTFFITNSFSRSKLNYESGIVKNIHYGDIHTKFSTLFDISKEEVPYINEDIPLNRIKKENYCKVGDIIFADASEDLDDVGKSIEIVNLNGEKLLSGLHTLLARQIDNDLELGFGGYLFKSPQVRKQIKREAQGAKVLGLSGTRLSNIKLCYPENKKEQKKIASCLTAVDELITAQTQKIEQLQDHKKGLMQRLFPKVKS